MASMVDALQSGIAALGYFLFGAFVIILIVAKAQSSSDTLSRRGSGVDILAPVRRTDPAFTWDAYSARVLAAYEAIQRARMVKQPNLAREWITPALLVGLQNEEAYAQRAGVNRTVVPIRVTQLQPRLVRSDGSNFFIDTFIVGDTTTLGYKALASIPESEIYLFERDDASVQISEVWTFCRPIGSLTATGPVDPRHCSHCGAPVEDPHAVSCPYCGEEIRYADWLVSAIAPADLTGFGVTVYPAQSQTGER